MAERKSQPRKRFRGGEGPNYLIEIKGRLVLVSGATGEVRALSDKDRDLILPLLKQRQELGKELAELLEKQGLDVSGDGTIELFVEPPKSLKKKKRKR